MKKSAIVAISLSAGSLVSAATWLICSKFISDEDVLFYLFFCIPVLSFLGICYSCKRVLLNEDLQPGLLAGGFVSASVFCSFWIYLIYEFFHRRGS